MHKNAIIIYEHYSLTKLIIMIIIIHNVNFNSYKLQSTQYNNCTQHYADYFVLF